MLRRAQKHGVASLEWVEASDGHEVGQCATDAPHSQCAPVSSLISQFGAYHGQRIWHRALQCSAGHARFCNASVRWANRLIIALSFPESQELHRICQTLSRPCTPVTKLCNHRLPLLLSQELIARGDTAEAASNAETAVTQLVQLFTIRAQARGSSQTIMQGVLLQTCRRQRTVIDMTIATIMKVASR
jgi:hypothetical protein